jgi:hypothetical protein
MFGCCGGRCVRLRSDVVAVHQTVSHPGFEVVEWDADHDGDRLARFGGGVGATRGGPEDLGEGITPTFVGAAVHFDLADPVDLATRWC